MRDASSRSGVGPYAMLAGAQVAVGAAAIFARFALGGAPPLAASAWRLVIASAVLLAIAGVRVVRQAHHDEIEPQHAARHPLHRVILIGAGVALAIHFGSWIWSLDYTSVAVSTLLVATTPIWTAAYDSVVHKRHLSSIGYGAFVAGAVGLALVVGFNRTAPPIPGHEYLGDALAVVGAIAIGAYFILIREIRQDFGTRSIVTRTYSWGALVLLAGSLAARQYPPAFSDGKAWGGILAMALVSQLVGHTAMNASLRWFTPNAVAMTTLLEPVIAAILALLIFGETLTAPALGGGVLVLLAIGAFLKEERRLEVDLNN